jgi:DNA-binding transcriptional regulator YhcF (GntR family)
MHGQRDLCGLNDLEIAIDRDAEVPIGVQLAWALRARVQDGTFEPGQRLPGIRELAEASGVNPNTVRAVYQRLDQEGLVDTLHGSGTFVARGHREPSDVAAIAANAAHEAHETGVDLREVAAALYMSPQARLQPSDPEVARRRGLREEIATLERAIGELEAQHPGVAPASKRPRMESGPVMLSVGQLDEVRTQLVRRLAAVQRAVDRLLEVQEGQEEQTSTAGNRSKPKARAAAKPKAASSPGRAPRPAAAGA